MSDLIKRSDAIKVLKDSVVEMGGDDFCEMGVHIDDIEAVVNAIPSEDRPQGEWIPSDWFDEWYGRTCECSVCGNEFLRFNFCPNCGARMKGTNNGEDIQSTDE